MGTFTDAVLMITGGTGSFGTAALKHFITKDIKEIRVYSRDEKKQYDIMRWLQIKYPDYIGKIKFYIGDIRDISSLKEAMSGTDYVFHAAALKQVPYCEVFPQEAIKTNILGTENVLNAAIENEVKKVVCLSTDKAVYPVSVLGISKAMMERIVYAKSGYAYEKSRTVLCCTRFGNLMCSRSSVIPLFVNQIQHNMPITITDPKMVRFFMNLDEAVSLVEFAFKNANPGDLFIKKTDAASIGDLAKALQKLFKNTGTKITGIRPGEKLYEILMTPEEKFRSENIKKDYFKISCDRQNINYNYSIFDDSYNTYNANILNVEQIINKLLTIDYIKDKIDGIR